VAILSILWVDSTCATAACFMSAQRVTFAISRDGVLPFSRYFRRLSKNKVPVHAAYLVCGVSIVITLAVIGSSVAFSAITATAVISTNVSYLIPIIARYTVGKKNFQPAKWNLGRWSPVLGVIAIAWILLLFSVLVLPQVYPVTSVRHSLPRDLRNIVLNRNRKPSITPQSASASSRWSASSAGISRAGAEGTGSPVP
jgi:amino acid transporter